MKYQCLNGLEPAEFFRWFGQCCQIPRGSGKEQAFNEFLRNFAAQRGLCCHVDGEDNVLIRVPATPGYEKEPLWLFQAHTDMVWRQDHGVEFNFENQPIALAVEGDRLTARGTTLGADNAVGLATMLALADGAHPHPELELLFTSREEVGMLGARAFDYSAIRARRMVNMDCGDSHVLCVTSAGSTVCRVKGCYPVEPVTQGKCLHLRLVGGLGGHGGLSANKGHACAANLLGDLLLAVPGRLCSCFGEGGILKECEAVAVFPETLSIHALQDAFDTIASAWTETDPGWRLEVKAAEAGEALSAESSAKVALALSTLRTGQFRADGVDQRIILTSGLISKFSLAFGEFYVAFSIRSALDAEADALVRRYAAILDYLGLRMEVTDRKSGWPEDRESRLREKFQAVHTRLFGEEMEIERVHGGIEVGVIKGAIPDMDAVGVAPTARGAHTTGEYLLLHEVLPYWQLILAVLAEKEAGE